MRKNTHIKVSSVILSIALFILALLLLYPLVWMAFGSLKNNDEIFSTNIYGLPTTFRFENYISAFTHFDILAFFRNSFIVAVATVSLTIIIAGMFSYATARMKWKLSNMTRTYAIMGMFFPVQVIIIPLVILIKNVHLQNTMMSLIIPYVVFNLSFTSMVFYAFFRSLPFELEESAAIDGASIYTTFFRIILPLVKPAIVTSAIFIFLNSWNELFTALIMISNNALRTLPLGLIYFQGRFATDWGASFAVMTISSILPIVLYLCFSRQVEQALTTGAVKG